MKDSKSNESEVMLIFLWIFDFNTIEKVFCSRKIFNLCCVLTHTFVLFFFFSLVLLWHCRSYCERLSICVYYIERMHFRIITFRKLLVSSSFSFIPAALGLCVKIKAVTSKNKRLLLLFQEGWCQSDMKYKKSNNLTAHKYFVIEYYNFKNTIYTITHFCNYSHQTLWESLQSINCNLLIMFCLHFHPKKKSATTTTMQTTKPTAKPMMTGEELDCTLKKSSANDTTQREQHVI